MLMFEVEFCWGVESACASLGHTKGNHFTTNIVDKAVEEKRRLKQTWSTFSLPDREFRPDGPSSRGFQRLIEGGLGICAVTGCCKLKRASEWCLSC